MKSIKSEIQNRKSKIGIIGLGYVGLPLAVEFGKKYFTIGFDVDINRINQLNIGIDRTKEVTKDQIEASKHLTFTSSSSKLADCEIFIITVPTPVYENKTPDFSPLISASKTVAKNITKNNIIIYESTVFPGATEEICVPVLEKHSNMIFNKDFFCGYSPERINPGDKKRTLTKITKITSGSNPDVAKIVDDLYQSIIIAGTHLAPSIKVAEAAKVIENVQRDVNIALMNELYMLFDELDVNIYDVLKAAGTKWNFLNFHPGLVGGHCIGVDPYYLTYKAEKIKFHPLMILSGRKTNDSMGNFIAQKIIQHITKIGINPIGAKIGIYGITFKPNCPDIRNTKVVSIIEDLKKYNCEVVVTDPWADKSEVKENLGIDLVDIDQMNHLSAGVLAVKHDIFKNLKNDNLIKLF